MPNETAIAAQPIDGDKVYQERARRALPILVRQAMAHRPIFYADLAAELQMPNPRTLNYVLGSVGQGLLKLEEKWAEKIPPIQCLVINKASELPGDGIGWFISEGDFRNLPKCDQRALVDSKLAEIFSYQKWHHVLLALDLPEPKYLQADLISAARKFGGGESDASPSGGRPGNEPFARPLRY